MPFGLATASAVFQRSMMEVLKGLPQTLCFQDDILVYGMSDGEHNVILGKVLDRLKQHGVTVKRKKCQFVVDSVQYLGHLIWEEGARPKPSLVEAIVKAPEPKTKEELRSFLGLSEFYHRFVPHFSSKSERLRNLLKVNCTFDWTALEQESFDAIKNSIAGAIALTSFDPECDTILTTDASISGLGATLSQRQKGVERVIGFASRALTGPESRYSTIEREALAGWWAMCHFRTYLWGAPFVLRTDHRPLVGLLTTKGSARATPRIENWYTRMLEYQYTVEYVPGNNNQLADCMSRLPLRGSEVLETKKEVCEVGWVETEWDNTHVACSREEWEEACSQDALVTEVKEWCEKGWPRVANMVPEAVRPYWAVKDELSVVGGLLHRQGRLVAPRSMRQKVLRLAHQGHKGASALKRTVREAYWWERMDREMEEYVRECAQCRVADKSRVVVRSELMPIEAPKDVWDTVGMDIIGPISALGEGVIYGITLIDYNSKWPEVQFVTKIDTATVIAFLRAIFAREGCPRHLLTDNGVQFV